MNALAIIVAVFPAVLIVGAILAPVLSHRRSRPFLDRPLREGRGSEDARSCNRPIPLRANEAGPGIGELDNHRVESGHEDQYFEDWMTLQERFID